MGEVLVVGATGLLGTAVCARARAQGHPVRAMVRAGSGRGAFLENLGCELVEGDLKDAARLAAVCAGVQAVVMTANSMASRRPGDTLESVDRRGSLALVRAAAEAGVGRLIYTSVSPGLPANNDFVRFKREVEGAVRSSGLAWTIVQPTAFMEIHAGVVGGWDFMAGRARVVGTGRTPVGYISLHDVAGFIGAALTHETATNRDLPLMGPEPLSALDAVEIAEQVTGLKFVVQRAPVPVVKAVRFVVGPFNPHLNALMGLLIGQASSQLDLRPAPYDEFGVRPTRFDEYVRQCVAPATRR